MVSRFSSSRACVDIDALCNTLNISADKVGQCYWVESCHFPTIAGWYSSSEVPVITFTVKCCPFCRGQLADNSKCFHCELCFSPDTPSKDILKVAPQQSPVCVSAQFEWETGKCVYLPTPTMFSFHALACMRITDEDLRLANRFNRLTNLTDGFPCHPEALLQMQRSLPPGTIANDLLCLQKTRWEDVKAHLPILRVHYEHADRCGYGFRSIAACPVCLYCCETHDMGNGHMFHACLHCDIMFSATNKEQNYYTVWPFTKEWRGKAPRVFDLKGDLLGSIDKDPCVHTFSEKALRALRLVPDCSSVVRGGEPVPTAVEEMEPTLQLAAQYLHGDVRLRFQTAACIKVVSTTLGTQGDTLQEVLPSSLQLEDKAVKKLVEFVYKWYPDKQQLNQFLYDLFWRRICKKFE